MDRAGHRGRHDLTGRGPQAGDVSAPATRLPRTRRMLAILLAVALLGGIALLVTATTGSSDGPPFRGGRTRLRVAGRGATATGIATNRHRGDHAGDPPLRTLRRHLPGATAFRQRPPATGVRAGPFEPRLHRAVHDRRDLNGSDPPGDVDAVTILSNGGAMAGSSSGSRTRSDSGTRGCEEPKARPDRGQLRATSWAPRRPRDPELLGVCEELRPPGPHVPAGHLV